ncbi:MAG: (d)CMP kinase [Buchnera aphidicola (Schlechtendalia peitan)]
MNIPVITIDGPSGSGKSELCKKISQKLQWNILPSGLIYRILALIILRNRNFIKNKNFYFLQSLNFFNIINENILKKNTFSILIKNINTEEIGNFASKLACIPYIRKYLLFKQRIFRQFPGLVADGRDMGTVVFPDACIKFFLKADLKIRAQRRLLSLKKNTNINFNQLLNIMKERDYRDNNRLISPLFPSAGSIIIDSTYMNIQQVFNLCINYIIKLNNIKTLNIHKNL